MPIQQITMTILNLNFGVSLTDFDGDTVEGHVTVNVLDDGPDIGHVTHAG